MREAQQTARPDTPPTLHSTRILAGLQTYGLFIGLVKTPYTTRTLRLSHPIILIHFIFNRGCSKTNQVLEQAQSS
jgi:hypothetical protein